MLIKDFKSEMWSAMYQIKAGMHKFADPILQAEGISMFQTYILFGLLDGSITNISSICKDSGINQGNVSSMCKQMEKDGLIKRNRSTVDERIVTLSITEEGKNIINRLYERADELDTILEKVPEQKLNAIVKGMHELSELLKILSIKNY